MTRPDPCLPPLTLVSTPSLQLSSAGQRLALFAGCKVLGDGTWAVWQIAFLAHLFLFFFFKNMAFQADQRIKTEIMTSLGAEHLFRLLSDADVQVLMKTLGLLRNLLASKSVSNCWLWVVCGCNDFWPRGLFAFCCTRPSATKSGRSYGVMYMLS